MAIVAAGALVLTACTSGDNGNGDDPGGNGNGDDPTSEEPGEDEPGEDGDEHTGKLDLGDVQTEAGNIAYSVGPDVYQGYNGNTADTNSTYNSVINARLSSGFWYWGTDGTVYPVEEFGSYEMINEDPLTVEYTISDSAVWEDGEPIVYDDFLLSWASTNPTALFGGDPGEGPFNAASNSFGAYVPDGPVGEPGGKTFTIEYPEPYPDWTMMVGGGYPSHVVARETGMTQEELTDLILEGDVGDALDEVGEFWSTGWMFPERSLPANVGELAPSSGPYSLDGATWQGTEYIQLVPNTSYFGPPPATENLTFRFVAPDAQVQALQNYDLNVIEPQAVVDTVDQLNGLGDGFDMKTGDEFTYEHLDYNMADDSPFADENGGLAAREAFANCVPRQLIVDNLITPVNPEGVVLNAREMMPFQPGYDEYVDAYWDGRYDEVNIDLATEKFAESGLEEGTPVRIGYGAPNQRRTDIVGYIKDHCDQVGFTIEDASADGLSAVLDSGDWEIALFAWAGSGTVAGGSFWYETDGGGNYGGYSNAEMDEAWNIIQTTIDEDEMMEQFAVVERLAWDDLHSITLFAHPGIVAHDVNVENIFHTAAQTAAVWNAEQWRLVQ